MRKEGRHRDRPQRDETEKGMGIGEERREERDRWKKETDGMERREEGKHRDRPQRDGAKRGTGIGEGRERDTPRRDGRIGNRPRNEGRRTSEGGIGRGEGEGGGHDGSPRCWRQTERNT